MEVYKRDNIDYNSIQEVLEGKLRAGTMLIEHVMELEKNAKQIGITEGKHELLVTKVIKLSIKKFGTIPSELEDKIKNCSDISKLDNIIDNIFDISSIREIEQLLH